MNKHITEVGEIVENIVANGASYEDVKLLITKAKEEERVRIAKYINDNLRVDMRAKDVLHIVIKTLTSKD